MPPEPLISARRRIARGAQVLALLATSAVSCFAGARAPDSPYVYAHHGVSTAITSAQAAFDRGLTLIYAYQEEEAERAFRHAARLDPSLAMAWWGVAMALGPDINNAPEAKQTVKAAKAIGRARLLVARRGTPAERDYIEALAARYSDAATPDFDALAIAYRDRMRALTHQYPGDPDAAALFAEAIMDVHPWRLWTYDAQPAEGTTELVAVLEAGLREHPEHVGLEHFYIHAVEASNDPGRALTAARRLAATHFEAAAAHLVHMPAHTFLRVGDWAAAEQANEHAVHHALDFRVSLDPGAKNACGHCLDFLAYVYSMEGNYAGARRAADSLTVIRSNSTGLIQVLARFHRYEELLALPEPSPEKVPDAADPHVVRATWRYGRAVARLGTDDLDGAATEFELLKAEVALAPPKPEFAAERPDIAQVYDKLGAATDADVLDIEVLLVGAGLAAARSDAAAAIAGLRAAVEVQDRSQYSEPPPWLYPLRETLAAALMRSRASGEAVEVLRDCLRRVPHDPRATIGLQAALLATGRGAEARAFDSEIAAARARADSPLALEDY